MTLMEQCRIWKEEKNYQKMISALEALSAGERTPELDSELAQAYCSSADTENRELFQKALKLLKPHEGYFGEDYSWNFRIAFAYFYLDREASALRYFKRALAQRPEDGDALEMISACRSRLTLPRFEKNFRQRTAEAWTESTETTEVKSWRPSAAVFSPPLFPMSPLNWDTTGRNMN